MSDFYTLTLWTGAVLSILGSALFGGLEIGIYSLNRVRLHIQAHAHRSSAAVLENLLLKPNRLLATLLVGNNMVNYLASVCIGALLENAGYSGWMLVAMDAAILAPVLVIFGEVVPKDLFRSHSDTLVYPFAWPLAAFSRVLIWIGLLPLIDGISHVLHSLLNSPEEALLSSSPRRVVTQLLREGVGHGVISSYQSDMVDRALQMGRLTTRDVMVPWRSVTTVRSNHPVDAVWTIADRFPFTRIPLLDPSGRPIGLIEVGHVLRHDPEKTPLLGEMSRPIATLAPNLSLRDALLKLQVERTSMGIVIENEKPIGLVTTKDLLEPLIGPIEAW